MNRKSKGKAVAEVYEMLEASKRDAESGRDSSASDYWMGYRDAMREAMGYMRTAGLVAKDTP